MWNQGREKASKWVEKMQNQNKIHAQLQKAFYFFLTETF